ncbi:MAG: ImmA/IrrE family metallo-endopeptidase [Candidatus Saccharibacteria bacterium]
MSRRSLNSQIQSKADKVLKTNRVLEPFVDVYAIAQREGIKLIPLIPSPSDREFSGFLDTNGDKPVIYVNATEPVADQTWTIAHELGHYYLGHKPDNWGINWRHPQANDAKDEFEQASDYFAACLLIPAQLLRKVMKKYKLTNDDFTLLSEMFGVSPQAMHDRLILLHL